MNYIKIYNKLCKRGKGNRAYTAKWGRWERHHIKPRNAGGNNQSSNITRLQHKEHTLAHHLLFRIYHRIQDKLAYKMLDGQVSNPWELPEFRQRMNAVVISNLQKVDREKLKKISSEVGKEMKRQHKGIYAPGMHKKAIEASQKWAKAHPDLASLRSSKSHIHRTQNDYERMANHKSKHLIKDAEGRIFKSVAEAANFHNLPRYTVDNWSRREGHGWSRIANTLMD